MLYVFISFLRHSPRHVPEGNLVYTYNCEICLRFRTYLFVRALLAKTPRRSIHLVRAVTVVAVWARSAQCVARGKRLKFFGQRGQIKQIPVICLN